MDTEKDFGLKETKDKLSFELDWPFITGMAERMDFNKGKYPPYNWHKEMDVQKLKNALMRHTISVMQDSYDDEQIFGHLHAIACNSMMIYYQLKRYGVKEREN